MNGRRATDIYNDEDTVSLIELWLIMVKRRKLIFVVWVSISLIGVIAATLLPDVYAYTTLIEIGNQVNGEGKTELVETVDAATTRLLAGIIPTLKRKFASEGKETYEVTVTVPEKSPSLILLKSQGPAQSASVQLAFQASIVDVLAQTHQVILDDARAATVAAKQEKIKRRVTALQDERELLVEMLKRVDSEKAYLKKQIEQLKVTIGVAIPQQNKAIAQSSNEATALTHLMVTNQREQLRRDLVAAEKRLILDLPIEGKQIRKSLVENSRAIEEQHNELNEFKTKLKERHATKTVLPPAQESYPVGRKRLHIIALATTVGLIIGLFGVFVREFFDKIYRKSSTVSGESNSFGK